MSTQELASRILQVLEQEPGLLGREIAERIGCDKKQVNGLLYSLLRDTLYQDSQYRWYPKQQAPRTSTPASEYSDTDLSRLARYYLACMGQDERGVSIFAYDKFGKPDYAELSQLPQYDDIFQQPAARDLLSRRRNDKGRMEVFFGYPTLLRPHQSAKGWRGFFVEPLFLYPVELNNGPGSQPMLQAGFPILNHKALQFLTRTQREALMEELVQLEEELGLTGQFEPPDLDELTLRLQAIRPEWLWVEAIDPQQLGDTPALAEAQQGGLYNRAMLVMAERSPFTQGLESELKQLAQLAEGRYQGSALSDWLKGTVESSPGTEQRPLIEVLPLNTEQRQAIQQALTNKLTIVTGPPGTGKSQVVTNLLINAAWQGKRVLFASKNNKAVDVVETRVNSLGPRPILLRVGSQQYQTRLAEYLLSMLSTTATAEDQENYREAYTSHRRIEERLIQLDKDTQQLISLRNQVDALEQAAEQVRQELSRSQFKGMRHLELEPLIGASRRLRDAIHGASKDQQPLLPRLLWAFKKRERLDQLAHAARQLPSDIETLGLQHPAIRADEASLAEWRAYAGALSSRLELVEHACEYFDALQALQSAKSLEEISLEQMQWIRALSDNAFTLWRAWLVNQPASLSKEDRQKLNRYHSLLKMVMDTGPDSQLSREVGKQYRSLFQQAAHLLPCWATTALSARGKIPFEPGFFDLVVFDEASQCDIASALPLLYRAKQAVVIGDPKQLSHISGLQRGQDQQLLEKHGLIAEFAHWAYSYNSLFDLAAGLVEGSDIVNLRDHHRSHNDIIEFSNREFYEGRLRVATRYDNLVRPSLKEPGIRWVNVQGQATRPPIGGAENLSEARQIAAEIKELVLERGYRGSIGVVSPFRSQANLIRKVVNADEVLAARLPAHDFLVDTVHKFQGDERDLMIFSPVVASGISNGALGFMRNTPNLFNVAITRARGMLVVVGDLTACSRCGIDYLERFASYSQALQQQSERDQEQGQQDLGPEYPAVSNPERVSDWERLFYRALYQAGIRAIPQYKVEKYDLDFALFVGDRKLNIEVDGERYHRNWTGELCRRDQMRNQRLFELGWDVKRFWVYEVRDDLSRCIQLIKDWKEQGREPL
ncbi:AAA domain-containing protein [Halomonas alkalicola]|uniref:AAA domain-containing protein n=1 Tax=Halomonas alkalicola TaxID=1930622 RepID=A0ABY9H5R1_9GAMM|nr:AAA domain-containing protein [Halomonas alkalicola]WLI73608.1 AAA domain-containing protein [Halomonas alkalicola]